MEDLPEDLHMVLMDTLSIVSIKILSHVNKFWYNTFSKYAKEQRDIDLIIRCYEIASEGSLKLLKWAHDNGYRWNESTCTNAAENGHLKMLKWARSEGCPWDSNTCAYAAVT